MVNEQKLSCTSIVGRIFLRQIGSDISFKNAKVTWHDKEMPLHPQNCFDNKHAFHKALANEPHSTAEACANIVIDAALKCTKTHLNQLASQQNHLTMKHKDVLLKMLQEHKQLFEGLDHEQLGTFPNCKCHIDLNLGAKAHHIKQPCSIPLDQVKAAKTEMQRQVNLGILIKKCCATEWGMHIFIIPKTDGTCRLVADF